MILTDSTKPNKAPLGINRGPLGIINRKEIPENNKENHLVHQDSSRGPFLSVLKGVNTADMLEIIFLSDLATGKVDSLLQTHRNLIIHNLWSSYFPNIRGGVKQNVRISPASWKIDFMTVRTISGMPSYLERFLDLTLRKTLRIGEFNADQHSIQSNGMSIFAA